MNKKLTDQEIEMGLLLAKQTKPAPWEWLEHGCEHDFATGVFAKSLRDREGWVCLDSEMKASDGAFIVFAREALPCALEELQALRSNLHHLKEEIKRIRQIDASFQDEVRARIEEILANHTQYPAMTAQQASERLRSISRSVREVDTKPTPAQWICGPDVGLSSRTIWAVMMNAVTKKGWYSVPLDNDDFGRCYRLLKLFPEWKNRLAEVSQRFPQWIGIVREWNKLEQMYERQENLFDMLYQLHEEGYLADGWVKDGGGWSKNA